MKRILLGVLAALAFASDTGCMGAYVDCDGEECDYADPPLRYETHPRYVYRDTAVYDVDGRYYRQYGTDHRWVAYRKRPKTMKRYEEHHDGDGDHGHDHDHDHDHH